MWKSQGFRLDPARRSRSEAAFHEAKVWKGPILLGFRGIEVAQAASRLTRTGAKVH
jgi:hypothetical protein